MGAGHDLASESHARGSGSAYRAGVRASSDLLTLPGCADVLSGVLQTAKLSGALFFLVDAGSPWSVAVPSARTFAATILPRAKHVVSYHVVTNGNCWGGLPGKPLIRLETGDILMLPHGDPYLMTTSPDAPTSIDAAETLEFFRAMAAGEIPFVVKEGGDGPERLNLVCGFLGCDALAFNPLLAALPPVLHLPCPARPEKDLLSQLIALAVAESERGGAGGECIRLRISELMFVELVRRYLAGEGSSRTGWLAGLADPAVGRALGLLHERPAYAWSLHELASAVGVSRSTLAERFADFVGEAPIQYLTRWRLQLAARLLTDTHAKVASVAVQVGYASEAAFSRAFKKLTGLSPVDWRARST